MRVKSAAAGAATRARVRVVVVVVARIVSCGWVCVWTRVPGGWWGAKGGVRSERFSVFSVFGVKESSRRRRGRRRRERRKLSLFVSPLFQTPTHHQPCSPGPPSAPLAPPHPCAVPCRLAPRAASWFGELEEGGGSVARLFRRLGCLSSRAAVHADHALLPGQGSEGGGGGRARAPTKQPRKLKLHPIPHSAAPRRDGHPVRAHRRRRPCEGGDVPPV